MKISQPSDLKERVAAIGCSLDEIKAQLLRPTVGTIIKALGPFLEEPVAGLGRRIAKEGVRACADKVLRLYEKADK